MRLLGPSAAALLFLSPAAMAATFLGQAPSAVGTGQVMWAAASASNTSLPAEGEAQGLATDAGVADPALAVAVGSGAQLSGTTGLGGWMLLLASFLLVGAVLRRRGLTVSVTS